SLTGGVGGGGGALASPAVAVSAVSSPSRLGPAAAAGGVGAAAGAVVSFSPSTTTPGALEPLSPLSRYGSEGAPSEPLSAWPSSTALGLGSPWTAPGSTPPHSTASPAKRPAADAVSAAWLSAAAATPPSERAGAGQLADIRRHALGALQQLVGCWVILA
ncbi:hypothetical protein Agub_g1567, partial [Astrephomene gubernaculifera]